jgi:hypothetical protein
MNAGQTEARTHPPGSSAAGGGLDGPFVGRAAEVGVKTPAVARSSAMSGVTAASPRLRAASQVSAAGVGRRASVGSCWKSIVKAKRPS